jgi:hypothetical protein
MRQLGEEFKAAGDHKGGMGDDESMESGTSSKADRQSE